MFNRKSKNNDIDLNQDVCQLADSLDDLLKSYGSKTKDEVDGARSRAEALLKETRAKLHGNNRLSQVAKDGAGHVDNYVRDKPCHGLVLVPRWHLCRRTDRDEHIPALIIGKNYVIHHRPVAKAAGFFIA